MPFMDAFRSFKCHLNELERRTHLWTKSIQNEWSITMQALSFSFKPNDLYLMKLLLQTKWDENRNWHHSCLALSLKPNLVDIISTRVIARRGSLVKLIMQVTYSDQRIEGAVKLSPGSTWSPGWDSLQARARGQPSTAASSGQPLRLSLSSFFFRHNRQI